MGNTTEKKAQQMKEEKEKKAEEKEEAEEGKGKEKKKRNHISLGVVIEPKKPNTV